MPNQPTNQPYKKTDISICVSASNAPFLDVDCLVAYKGLPAIWGKRVFFDSDTLKVSEDTGLYTFSKDPDTTFKEVYPDSIPPDIKAFLDKQIDFARKTLGDYRQKLIDAKAELLSALIPTSDQDSELGDSPSISSQNGFPEI